MRALCNVRPTLEKVKSKKTINLFFCVSLLSKLAVLCHFSLESTPYVKLISGSKPIFIACREMHPDRTTNMKWNGEGEALPKLKVRCFQSVFGD